LQIGVGVGEGVGVNGDGVGDGDGVPPATTLKLPLEISKKIFPTASIFTRAVVVNPVGIVTPSLPSFGVPARSVIGKVFPPSVDIRILTRAVDTGGLLVFATFQVIVAEFPPPSVSPPFGNVTAKGPLFPSTKRNASAVLIPPVPG
jgi:hypothetical protein